MPFVVRSAYAQSGNDSVKVGMIGVGGRGAGLLRSFDEARNSRVVAVCDLDPARLTKAAQSVRDPGQVRKYTDYRRLLEDKDVDAVVVATPDHWHTPLALSAILAGKHVYVEKPCSHNIREANLLVKCAREHKKCVQHGTQRRSTAMNMAGVRAIREGLIGDVFMAKAINHQLREDR